MKTNSFLRSLAALALALVLMQISALRASACPFCYGDTSGDKMSHAADVGIIAMVIIMIFMLSALGGFMWYLAYRAKHPLPDYNELLSEEGGLSHAQPDAL
jgi:hypothetical protein